eukprot:3275087-Pleurochrysis_carterae.AAC.5
MLLLLASAPALALLVPAARPVSPMQVPVLVHWSHPLDCTISQYARTHFINLYPTGCLDLSGVNMS